MSSIITILDQDIQPLTPTFTDWFSNCQFLVFQSTTTGEYTATGEFLEVAVVLFAQISSEPIGAIERIISDFRDTIDTINLIVLPESNNCFPFRLSINPSAGFHARILAISC